MPWKIKHNEEEIECPDVATLKAWATEGRVTPEDYVFNPTLNQWIYAKEAAELQGLFQKAKRTEEAGTLKKAAWGLAIVGALLFLIAPPLAGVSLLGAAICAVMHHVKAGTVV